MLSLSFGDFLTSRWLPAIEHTVRPSTFTSYRAHVISHIAPRIGRVNIHDIDATTLNSFYADLLANGRAKGTGGLSPSTVRRVHSTIHRALRDAVRWGHLEVMSQGVVILHECASTKPAAGLRKSCAPS
jgi:integrase